MSVKHFTTYEGTKLMRASSVGLGLAVFSAATFGTSGSFTGSLMATGWTPGAAVTVRISLAALMLTVPAVLQLRGRWSMLRRSLPTVLAFGLFAVGGAQLFFFNAIEHLSVAVGLLLEYSGTLLVVGWVWLRHGQRPRRLTLAGAAIALSGLVLVLGLSFIAAAVAYAAGIGAARRLGARLASFVGLAEVLFAVLFAWILLGQQPTLLQAVGGLVVLAGIALVKADERDDRVVVGPEPDLAPV